MGLDSLEPQVTRARHRRLNTQVNHTWRTSTSYQTLRLRAAHNRGQSLSRSSRTARLMMRLHLRRPTSPAREPKRQAHQSLDNGESPSRAEIDGCRTPTSCSGRGSYRLRTPTKEKARLRCGYPSTPVTGNLGGPSGLGGLFCLARLHSLLEITMLPAESDVTPAIKELSRPILPPKTPKPTDGGSQLGGTLAERVSSGSEPRRGLSSCRSLLCPLSARTSTDAGPVGYRR
jgi:hypothetical protein